ncbi:hypothetical protein O6P43_013483 [Quillaja saponaria]|uniref:Uncharacterized protein n=1 Tax=Quillaja saponaria TaxID=32244 RepID=A0AAD7LSY8_QUISA|nr:hypothetical protein O6P43_013483 [Quillaja saponaria]
MTLQLLKAKKSPLALLECRKRKERRKLRIDERVLGVCHWKRNLHSATGTHSRHSKHLRRQLGILRQKKDLQMVSFVAGSLSQLCLLPLRR